MNRRIDWSCGPGIRQFCGATLLRTKLSELSKDLLDWLKYAQSETTGIKLGFSKGEVAELDAQFEALWRESVEEEVNRRLAARGLTVEVQQGNGNQRQIRDARDTLILTSGANR